MKRSIVLPMLAAFMLFSGFVCAPKRPASVEEAAKLRKDAYLAANEGKTEIINAILEVYRKTEYARIDREIELALEADFAEVRKNAAATGGVVPVELAIAGTKKLNATRDAEREKFRALVDEAILQIKAEIDRADSNVLIANKLNDAIDEYERAGIDTTAAKKAVDEILSIVTKDKQKPKAEIIRLPGAK